MVNLHAAGGAAMMEAALEGLVRPDGSRPLLIAVTPSKRTPGVTVRKPPPQASWTFPASRGEHTTPSSTAGARR